MSLSVRRYQENTKLLYWLKWVTDLLVIIALAYAATIFICDKKTVIGSSMETAIASKDTVLVNRLAYTIKKPARFDVVSFKLEGETDDKTYVKRVIGLPGETVQIKDGKVYINGEMLNNDISSDSIITAGIARNEIKLNEHEYFLLGDKRNNSEDSRFAGVGIVNIKQITGKCWFIANPVEHCKFIK